METTLQSAILPITKIVVKSLDEAGKEVQTEYKLVLDYNAIARAEEVIKRDLSKTINWVDLSGPQLSAIVWSALGRYHPKVTLEECRGWLAPAQHGQLFELLIEQCHPGILDRIQLAIEAAKKLGEQEPNPPAKE